VKRDSSDSDIDAEWAVDELLPVQLLSNLVILGGWPIEYKDEVDMSDPIRPCFPPPLLEGGVARRETNPGEEGSSEIVSGIPEC
jgi:hypothetical protein